MRKTTKPFNPEAVLFSIASKHGLKPSATLPAVLGPSDFGAVCPQRAGQRPMTAKEAVRVFGKSDSVKMNFIPMMMIHLMYEQVDKLVEYCVENRLEEHKKMSRVLRFASARYRDALRATRTPGEHQAFLRYYDRFRSLVAKDVWLMELEADTISKNELRGIEHHTIAAQTLIIVMLLRFIIAHDTEMDKMISARLGAHVKQNVDECRKLVMFICRDGFANAYGYRLTPNEHMRAWLRIICNRANSLVDRIIEEEA